jgi:hypothetical protein
LKRKRGVLGLDHPSTLISMSSLALIYQRDKGRLDDAEDLNEQAFETFKRLFGLKHPDTLSSMNNLAVTWKRQGRDAEAIQLMEECVQLRRRILGENHPYTLSSSKELSEWQAETTQLK